MVDWQPRFVTIFADTGRENYLRKNASVLLTMANIFHGEVHLLLQDSCISSVCAIVWLLSVIIVCFPFPGLLAFSEIVPTTRMYRGRK